MGWLDAGDVSLFFSVLIGTLLGRLILWGIEEVEDRRVRRLPRVGAHFRE